MNGLEDMIRRARCLLVALAISSSCLAASRAMADTVVDMWIGGRFDNRIDIVVLGDGYRAAQMTKFATDATTFMNAFFAEQPLNSYKKYFNVRRINTPSVLSGAGTAPGRNTVYSSYFFCNGLERLLCADINKVQAVLSKNLPAAKREVVIVLVNDTRYGGAGGAIAVASMHVYAKELALHELGHSFGNLDDEYDYGTCHTSGAWGFNVTRQTVRASIPWTKWIPAATPVPTPTDRGVGLYRGAYYCTTGWYRPTFDSKMRTLLRPFQSVNGEQLIRRIYQFVNSIDAVSPMVASVRLTPGTQRIFTVVPINPASATLRYAWRLGGVLISTGKTATVRYTDVSVAKQLQLIVTDATAQVRNDPANVRIDRRNWTVSR